MRRINGFMLIILAILMMACGGKGLDATSTPAPTVTKTVSATSLPTATPTATKKPIPTRTPTLPNSTPQPTPTATLLFGNLPEGEASEYSLKSWNDEDAWKLSVDDAPEFPAENGDSYGYAAWLKVQHTLLREIIAHFPASPHYADAKERLMSPVNYSWAHSEKAPIEPFRQTLENALNAQPDIEISAEAINLVIAKILYLDNVNDYPFATVLPADNILGDGMPGWVLSLRVPAPGGAAFVLAGKPGAYRLVSPLDEWRLFAWDDQQIFTYDLNANGIPEISTWDSYWGMGMSHFCNEIFGLYEWNGSQFVNLTPDLSTSANTDMGACLNFEFVEGPNGTQAITTGNVIDTGCFDRSVDMRNLGSLIVKRRYEWNGRYFTMTGEESMPFEDSIPDDWPIVNKCTLGWANEAGVGNDQAFEFLPALLAETDPDLTTAFSDAFGPAYLDYFRFKLGTWYAIRGQQSLAQHLLTQVRDAPANPQYNTSSQLATAYLQAYSSTGTYAGCVATENLLDFSQFKGELGGLRTGDMENTWGFSEWQWSYSGQSTDVCNLRASFRYPVQQQNFRTSQSFLYWLDEQQIPYTSFQEGDVDGDGQNDWLILLGTGENQSWDVWVLLNKNGKNQPVFVANTQRSAANIPTTWNTFTPDPLGDLINIYQWTDGMLLFRIFFQNGEPDVEIVHPLIDYYLDPFFGFTVLSTQKDDLPDSSDGEKLRVQLEQEFSWQKKWYILGWDSMMNRLRIVSSPGYDQEQQIQIVENLLFEQLDPKGALEILTSFSLLNEYSQLIVDEDVQRYDTLPTIHPYLQYLLGLAYEMSGDETNAVQAYWTLWHDHPLHPLSYIVQQKLERKP